MSCHDFADRHFERVPVGAHNDYIWTDYKSLDLDDPKYDWQYFRSSKYSEYAIDEKSRIKRGLTMGEFYGTNTVD